MLDLVYAATTCVVGFAGRKVHLCEDDAWAASDPFVRERPELFRPLPRNVFSSTGRVDRPVETAAVEPGGKRRRG